MTRIVIILAATAALAAAQDHTNALQVIPTSDGTQVGQVNFMATDNLHSVGLAAPNAVPSSILFRLPAADGGNGNVLTTDGSQNLAWAPNGGASSIAVSASNPLYFYCHFRDDDKTAVYFDFSTDALNWRPVKKNGSFATTENRDPTCVYHDGKFMLLTSPNPATPAKVPYYWSTDLITFNGPVLLDMGLVLAGTNGAWAPEWDDDTDSGRFGFWVALTTNGGGTFTPYFLDFDDSTYAVTPHAITLTGTAQSKNFDFFPFHQAGSATHYLFYVDEYQATPTSAYYQYIAYATSSTLTGAYAQQTPAASPTTGDYFGFSPTSEAPSIMQLPNGCIRVFADTWLNMFNSTNNAPRKYLLQAVDACSVTPFATLGGSGATATSTVSGGVLTGVNLTAGGTNYWLTPYVTLTGGGGAGAQARAYVRNGVVVDIEVTAQGQGFTSAPTVAIARGPWPMNIAAAEHGTVMAITDPLIANVVYNAAEAGRNNFGEYGRVVFGDAAKPGFFTVTARARAAHYFLAYDEAPTFAAESADGVAATWSGCGNDQYSCPPPVGGAGRWVDAFSGNGPMLQLNNTKVDVGESSILFGNTIYAYGGIPLTGSAMGMRSLWTIGENNQYFGDVPNGGNVAGNWFFVYNRGLGGPGPAVFNQGFETGDMSGWGCINACAAVSSPSRNGGYSSRMASSAGNYIYEYLSGAAPAGAQYVITAWVRTDGGTAAVQLRVGDYGSGGLVVASATATSSWQPVSVTFTGTAANNMAVSLVSAGAASGAAYLYWDDVTMTPLSPTGAFPFGISPYDGTVRAGYGLMLGGGDATSLLTDTWANVDAFGKGFVDIGDGVVGRHNAFVQTGTLQLWDYAFVSGNSHSAGLYINNVTSGGEAALWLGNAITQATLGADPPTSSAGAIALWKLGSNSSCFGTASCGGSGTNNNWLYVFNGNSALGTNGGFPLGISPTTGEVRANYALTLGGGASTALTQAEHIRLTAATANVLQIDDGAGGSRNGIVQAGVFDAAAVYRLNGGDVAGFVGAAPTWYGGVSTTAYGVGANGFFDYYGGAWHTGVTGAIACNTATIQYKDWSGTNQSMVVCTSIPANQFYGGIRTL